MNNLQRSIGIKEYRWRSSKNTSTVENMGNVRGSVEARGDEQVGITPRNILGDNRLLDKSVKRCSGDDAMAGLPSHLTLPRDVSAKYGEKLLPQVP